MYRVALCAFTLSAGSSFAHAEDLKRDERPVEPNQCITHEYDPKSYKWLTFKNNCNLPLKLTYVWESASGGSKLLKPNQKDSAGYTQAEVEARGGFAFAACMAGFHTVASDGGYWKNAKQPHHCRKD